MRRTTTPAGSQPSQAGDHGVGGRPPLVAGVVTTGAVALAIAHLAFPDLKVDGVTVALLVVSLVPWLGPIFKSIELPGGWKLEFQQFKQQVASRLEQAGERVESLAERVERVERLSFTPTVGQELSHTLEDVVSRFHDRLVDAGLQDAGPAPSVRIDHSIDTAWYDGKAREIVLGPRLADDPDVTLREYTHHLLLFGRDYKNLVEAAQALESGLADFFPCSFTGDPALGRKVAKALNTGQAWIRNLANDRAMPTPSRAPFVAQAAGEVWGAALWDLRSSVGPELADHAALMAWQTVDLNDRDNVGQQFVSALIATLPDRHTEARCIFERRGLVHPAAPPRTGRQSEM